MSVVLEPSHDLDFPHLIPPGKSAICLLSITNQNTYAVDYKVMTTAPKRYLARPNKGRIEAGECLDVILHYQLPRTNEERQQQARNKSKFLIESKMVSVNEKKYSILHRLKPHGRTEENEKFKVHRQELTVRTLPPVNENENEKENAQSPSSDCDGLPTYDEVLSGAGNIDLLSHVEGVQRELDHLQMTINDLRGEVFRHSAAMV